jgi:hypothetical protein
MDRANHFHEKQEDIFALSRYDLALLNELARGLMAKETCGWRRF